MPTYEYRCRKCGHRFSQFQRITEPPVKKCPKCQAKDVERLISGGAGLIFKGSGFYITDYRRQSRDADKGEKTGKESAEKKEGKKEN